jgi:hypothetical protein
MLHRSALLAFTIAALLLPATAAHAADPVVAGPLPDGTTATATVSKGKLCLTLHLPQDGNAFGSVDTEGGGGCGDVPVLAPLGFADDLAEVGEPMPYDAGATGTDIVAVELRKAGKVLAHVATQPSALPGAPDLRFYLISAKGDPDEVAFLDASGTVRRATDTGGDGFGFGDPPTTARRAIAHGTGLHGGRWTLSAYGTRAIVPTPLQPERRLPEACVSFAWTAGGEHGATGACDQPGLEGAAVVVPELSDDACGAFGRFVGALVRSRVARLVAVLGDGARRTLALHPIPPSLGGPGLRAGVVVVSTRDAIRSLVAYDRAGKILETDPVRAAPRAPRACARRQLGGVSGESIISFSRGGSNATLGAGPHRLAVTDDGALICFAADRAPVAPGECSEPPVDLARTDLWAQPEDGGRFVYGIVPPEVATARLTLDDGSTRDLLSAPIAGYGGQYAAVLREIAADVPGTHRAVSYTLLDARGRTLASGVGPEFPAFHDARTIGRVPGLGTLFYSPYDVARSVKDFGSLPGCVSVGRPSADPSARQRCLPDQDSELALEASCATRRIVVSVALAHRADRASVVLASGREVALRTIALPAGRQRSEGAAVAVGVLGPRDAPRAVLRRGRSPKRRALALPPVAEQCGYRYDTELDGIFAGED